MNLIKVFEDTLDCIKDIQNDYTPSVTTKHTFVEIKECETESEPIIEVINSDTVSAIVEYSKLGKTCALNMASYKKPGGGVQNGARAQEECLFRSSNLFNVVSKDFYPLKDDECLYTTDAIFVKDVNYHYMKPVQCDILTIAAINLNKYAKYDDLQQMSDSDYEKLTKEKIRLMLTIPSNNQIENLILGAWGCGVFDNDPAKISRYFKEVILDGYGSNIKRIVFAIINDHNSVGNNFEIFKNTL